MSPGFGAIVTLYYNEIEIPTSELLQGVGTRSKKIDTGRNNMGEIAQ